MIHLILSSSRIPVIAVLAILVSLAFFWTVEQTPQTVSAENSRSLAITGQSVDIDYGEKISISTIIDVGSSAKEIDNVRALFRAHGGSTIWSYSYPNYSLTGTDSSEVMVEFDILTGPGSYYPPGAEFDIKFEITDLDDVTSSIISTDSIEYLDPASTDGGKLTREEALFTNQKLGQIRSLPRGAAFESPVAEDADYADGRVAEETIRRLEAARERRSKDGTPFFITAGFVRPHLPFSAPKKYWDMFDPAKLPMPKIKTFPKDAPPVALKRGGEIAAYKPVPTSGQVGETLKRELIHGYYASTSYADAQIGKVTAALDRLGLAKNTIIVLWGDHGWHLGDLGIWTKHTNFEQANRIPILIVGPGVAKPGSVTLQLTETVDIFPTLAELAGLPAPKGPQPIDGVSLVPVLKNPQIRVRNHAFHAYPRRKLGRAIRTERYRLVEWKIHAQPDGKIEYELYDYQSDPHETKNHAGTRPKVVEKLKAILAKHPKPAPRSK